MTINFTPPERDIDTIKTISKALSMAGDLFSQNPLGALSQLPDLRRTEAKPENLAWLWFTQTLTHATAEFLGTVIRDFKPQGDTRAASKDFVKAALPCAQSATFTPAALLDPGGNPAFAAATDPDTLHRLMLDISAQDSLFHGDAPKQLDDYVSHFKELLRRSSNHVLIHDASLAGLADLPFSADQTMRRDLAWARHAEWIHEKFDSDPVFSPKEDVTTPLSRLYLRLRCIWHEELPSENENRHSKVYRAHLADLHDTVTTWLDNKDKADNLRLITGGPGSGKSSFARAFAHETLKRGTHRVLFFEMQHLEFSGDLESDITRYLQGRYKPQKHAPSPGMDKDALEWLRADDVPALLIFDGLDEVTYDHTEAHDLARKFINKARKMVNDWTRDDTPLQALVLGRDAAIQSGMDFAKLPAHWMLKAAPIREIDEDDLARGQDTQLPDLDALPPPLTADQRPGYWHKWAISQRGDTTEPPGVTAEELGDLNAEPLLLHLLILSGYCGDKWRDAVDNRNLVYDTLLRKIHNRDDDRHQPRDKLSEEKFFLLMGCLGLAAWGGDSQGRSGTLHAFDRVYDEHADHAFEGEGRPPETELNCVVLHIHARMIDASDRGFEFIHKSFGEYLTARALMSEALRIHECFTREDDPVPVSELLKSWAKLIHDAALTEPVIQFLYDEARLRAGRGVDLAAPKATVEALLQYVAEHGVPVHETGSPGSYRDLETRQRCAETALIACGSAMTMTLPEGEDEDGDPARPTLKLSWDMKFTTDALHRLHMNDRRTNRLILRGADIESANLRRADLESANLRGAKLGGADLEGADLREADLESANLRGAYLIRTDLGRADLGGAKLGGADLGGAGLGGADLRRANLGRAYLRGASLEGADLEGAELNATDLSNCRMEGTLLRLVDLSETLDLSQESVDDSFGVKAGFGQVTLPEGLTYPDHWHVAEAAEEDSDELVAAFRNAYNKWRDNR